MESFQTFILLMFAGVILVGMAQKIHIPYPIALVLGGAAIGFIPNLPPINFDPHLILVVVLPPVLYYAAFGISYREFKKNWRDIFSLALGLVFVSTFVIGLIFKMLFPEFSWALAFAFGAIVSPPDAAAATTILKRFSISPRLLSILEGESLINDASALVLYRLAVAALLSGVFSFTDGSLEFFKVVSGGLFIGFALGYLIQRFSRRYLEPILGAVFSFTIPYITYIIADIMGVSGVLAVVTNGLMGAQLLRTHHSSLRRILAFATWDIFIILLNCFVFILIGLQLRTVTAVMSASELVLYAAYALMITFAMIIIRIVWVYAKSGIDYLKALRNPKSSTICPVILRDAALIGWSGMRGIVSFAAALALPLTYTNGIPIEGRNEVIFITFVVILMTLLIPGFTLSPLIRWLKIHHHSDFQALRRVRKQLAKIADEHLQRVHALEMISDEEFEYLAAYFNLQTQILEITTSMEKTAQNLESARVEVLQAQRRKLLEIWEKQEIDDKLLTLLEHELDVEEIHNARAELK